MKKANTAAEQARSAASQSRTVASRTSKEVDSAKKANAQAKKQAENKKSNSCETNSFVPGTGVLMADGSVTAIDDVAVGDTVVAVAADGTRTHRQVVATITGHGAKDLVGLTLVGAGGGGPPAGETITATDGHLFLTADGQWVPAKGLQVGDQLVDPDGTPVTIGAVERSSVVSTVHNLTVETDHTYSVVTAAGTDVVTHNESFIDLRDAIGDAELESCPVVRSDGAGATAAEMAASKGGPTGGSRAGQSTVRRDLIDAVEDGIYECWRCGQTSTNPANMHLGHRNVPTSKSGNLSPENVCLEGAACNLSAGNRGRPRPGMSCVERGSCGAPYGRTD